MVVMVKERNVRFKTICGYSLHYELSTDIKNFLINRTAILVLVCIRSGIFSKVTFNCRVEMIFMRSAIQKQNVLFYTLTTHNKRVTYTSPTLHSDSLHSVHTGN